MNVFESAFADHLSEYVTLRRRLGLQFETQESILQTFDRYVTERSYDGSLTEKLACEFALSVADPKGRMPARRYLIVRHFAEYLAAHDPSTPRLDPKAIVRRRSQPPPYILSEDQVTGLLAATHEIRQRSPVSNLSLFTMVGLAVSTGLRPGEVTGLDHDDIDFDSGIVRVRRSKFDKDRLVPVHPTTLDALSNYAGARDPVTPVQSEPAFFLSSQRRRYQTDNLDYLFRRIVNLAGLQPRSGRYPTFRSLRHTFAVNRLLQWYRAGADVQAQLPFLATYMGHVHYTSTAYYLNATPELLAAAADRLTTPEDNHGQQT